MSLDHTPEWNKMLRFIRPMQRILGCEFISVASREMDMQENTDLVIFGAQELGRGITIAARVREWSFAEGPYRFDVTLRASRPSGAKTELDKVLDGWGDFMLYGFGREADGRVGIPRWTIVDLGALRRAIDADERWFKSWAERLIPNADRSSRFVAIDARELHERRCLKSWSEGYFGSRRTAQQRPVAQPVRRDLGELTAEEEIAWLHRLGAAE